ncbi:hypothetical protein ACHAPV_004581 [Trichoderma viride]
MKFSKTEILDDLNNQAKWKRDMPNRYAVSKFLEHIANGLCKTCGYYALHL